MVRKKGVLAGWGAVVTILVVFAGCSETSDPLAEGPQFAIIGAATACTNAEPELGYFKLIKEGGWGEFSVVVRNDNGDVVEDNTVSLDAGDCAEVHINNTVDWSHVTVTEVSADPISMECVAIGFYPSCLAVTANSAFHTIGLSKGAVATFTNPPQTYGEGCTPGYWKNHTDEWPTGYLLGDSFNAIFGVDWFDDGFTLFEALSAKNRDGGGYGRIARHGTAALLSAAHSSVDYSLSIGDVLDAVLAGDADLLEMHNELESPGFCE